MKDVLLVIQLIVSVSLMAFILIQSRGKGFSRSFGSSQTSFTRRGLEKLVFKATFVLTAIFIVVSILQIVY